MTDYEANRIDTNKRVLATVKVDRAFTARFDAFIKGWPTAQCGPKPTAEMLMVGALFSKKLSVKQAGFHAMQLRDGGCTVQQLGIAFNCGPAHNHTRDDLVAPGYFKRSALSDVGSMAKAFTLEFTKKGETELVKLSDRLNAGQAQPVAKQAKAKVSKAKATKRAAKPKGELKPEQATTPAAEQTPTSEAPTVTEGHRPTEADLGPVNNPEH